MQPLAYSITTNQTAIIALFRVINRYVGKLPPMPGVFPDYPAPVIRNNDAGTEMVAMRWRMPPPARTGGPTVTNIRNASRIGASAQGEQALARDGPGPPPPTYLIATSRLGGAASL